MTSPTPSAEKLLNIGDKVYQFTWRDFEGSLIEREVECVIYYEHKNPEDCFYRYSLKGFYFYQDNLITNRGLGSKWFATRESAQSALDKEIEEAKENRRESLQKEIEEAEKKLSEIPPSPSSK